MRIFSGPKTPEFPTLPKIFTPDDSSSIGSNSSRSRRGSFIQALSSPRIFSGSNSNSSSPVLLPSLPHENSNTDNISRELVPIVTLLSAHAHRRYHTGVFLLLEDLRSDGSPGARDWKEVYGMLVGTQLALWDAKELAACNKKESKYKLKQVTSKPRYVNFTDAAVRVLDGTEAVVTESNKKLTNTLVVSTTLKNRYFLQFNDKKEYASWNAAIQLSLFEGTSLQEAYTGAFLSSRGALLGDIKTLLDSKFDYEDWVSVRFGTGMPWKRCFAVITQAHSRKKSALGQISFFENDKKTKKNQAIATVVTSKRLYAVYPSSPQLIDSSTIIKLEGTMKFEKKDIPQETNVFIMPEKHQAVPGYDTIIRFLIPAMNAFKLYGRPKKLIANKDDPSSLLFGLPTLPHVHYLKAEDLLPLANSPANASWSSHDWTDNIKEILLDKMSSGYSGCGNSAGVMGAISSPKIGSSAVFSGPYSPSLLPETRHEGVEKTKKTSSSKNYNPRLPSSRSTDGDVMLNAASEGMGATPSSMLQSRDNRKNDNESTATISIYSGSPRKKRDTITESHDPLSFKDSSVNDENNGNGNNFHSSEELGKIYHKYSSSPFGNSIKPGSSPQISEHLFDNPYRSDNRHEASGNTINEEMEDEDSYDSAHEEEDALREFNDLAKRINELNIGAAPGPERRVPQEKASPWGAEESSAEATGGDEDNVFDPDFVEQNEMLEMNSKHTENESLSDISTEDPFKGVSARGLGLETIPQASFSEDSSKPLQDPFGGVNPTRNKSSIPPAAPVNPYERNARGFPPTKMPYGHRQPLPSNHAPRPMMKPAGGFPYPNNAPQQAHHHRHHHNPQARGAPYPMNGAPNRMNGFPPQKRMYPGAMGPNQPMYPYGGGAGSYPPPGRQQPGAKAKPGMGNGFARYMPSTTVNPYAK